MVPSKDAVDTLSVTTLFSSESGVATPTTDASALDDPSAIDEWLTSTVERSTYPSPGSKFLIIDHSQNRALVCHHGSLHLEAMDNIDLQDAVPKHWQWFSTENDGFLGFRNVANGGYLGHDIWWDFYAKVYHHKGWENFSLNRRESGHYWIQTLYWWQQWQVSARSDGGGLFAEERGGTLWRFVKVY